MATLKAFTFFCSVESCMLRLTVRLCLVNYDTDNDNGNRNIT